MEMIVELIFFGASNLRHDMDVASDDPFTVDLILSVLPLRGILLSASGTIIHNCNEFLVRRLSRKWWQSVSRNRSTYYSFSSSSLSTPNARSSHIGFRATDAGYSRRSGATESKHVISMWIASVIDKGSWNSFQIGNQTSPSIWHYSFWSAFFETRRTLLLVLMSVYSASIPTAFLSTVTKVQPIARL